MQEVRKFIGRQTTEHLVLFLIVGVVCGLIGMIIAASDNKRPKSTNQDRIEIISPNGRYKVVISATDDSAGIWAIDTKNLGSSACLYNYRGEGPVVGVYSPGYQELAAYLALNSDSAGVVGYRKLSELKERPGSK
jgi:hypothetical protein